MKLKRIFGLVLLFALAVVLVACGNNKTNDDDLLKTYLLNVSNVVEGDFVVDATLKVGEKAYDLSWTSSDDCLKIAPAAQDGTYTVTVTRPEEKKEVTLTVKLGDATKTFTFQVNPYTVYDFTKAYVFAQDKAIVSEDFDLDTTFTKWGKTCTIEWESLEPTIVTIEGGKAKVNAPSAKKTVQLKAKFSYAGEESIVRFSVVAFEAMDNMETINNWYTNTGIAQTLSGYVLGIATVYNATYGNISVYLLDDSMKAGYYVYRGLCDAETAAKIVPGCHITVTGSTNTCYSGYWETNEKTGTITVDEGVEPIDPKSTIIDYDNELISKAPAYVYRQSSLVKLNGWKIVAKLAAPTSGASTTILTLEKDGVQIGVSASKYCESEYKVWAADADPAFQAITDKYNALNVGDYVDVVGYLYARDGDLINLYGADYLTVSSDKGESDAKEIAPVVASVAFEKKYSEAKTLDLVQSTGNVTVSWRLSKDSKVAKIENNQLVITPGEDDAQFTLIGTFAKGAFSIDCYYTIKVGVIDNSIKTIAAARELAAATETTIQGTVMAINTKGYILYDGTAAIYVYVAGTTEETEKVFVYKVGDTIKVEGKLDAYKGLIEYIPTQTTRVEINESVAELVDYTAADIQAYVAATNSTYAQDLVQLEGVLSISEDKKYYNVAVEGLTDEQITLVNLSDEVKAMIDGLNGKNIKFSGYALGQSSNKFFNVMVASIDSALTIEGALKGSKGTTVTIEGQVVAASLRGYVVYDGTAAIYVYAKGSKNADLQDVYFFEEDFVTITGTLDFYNVVELIPTAADYMEEEPESLFDQGKAEVMDVAAIKAYVSAENTDFPVKLVEITGKVSISNGYYNLIVGEGENTASVSFSYITDEQKAEYVDGETYTVYAYAIGHSKNTYMNIIPCSYLAPLDPYQEVYKEGALYVNPEFTAESCSWGGQTLTYGVNGFADLVEAIAAAESGAEIYLQAGEYVLNGEEATKNYDIEKDLKIYGPNAGIPGYAKQRHPEAVICQLSSSVNVCLKSGIEFDGVQFKGRGIGFISHDFFTANTGFKGITIKNSIASHITSFVKVKDAKTGDSVIENCYFHGINQFIAWISGGTLLVVNNVISGEDCGGVTNANGAAFRLRGVCDVKIYHNTFLGDYTGYKYFEANVFDGTNGSLDIQYNNFNCVETFFLNFTQGGVSHKAVLNNNIYTDGMDQATAIPATMTADITSGITTDANTFATIEDLEAAWAALGFKYVFKVTFDADGGSEVAPIEFKNFANVVLPVPTKEGKAFAGWYNGETKVDALTANADITLKAKWIDAATLTYDVDGGTPIDPVQFTDYTQVVLVTPVKEGFEFLGWYNGETKVTALSENNDITLKAKWAQIFTVTFDVDGGVAVENISFIDFTKVVLPYTTKDGKAFAGWYNGEAKVTALTENANIALKANWIDPVTLTYDVDGGNALDPVTFTDYKQVELATPTKDGFAFGGWYNGEAKVEALTENASITLKAKWIEIVQLNLPENVASKNIDIVVLADADAEKGYYNGETRVAAYATIKDAIDAAEDGASIYLPAGDHTLLAADASANYAIKKNLKFYGPNAGVAGTATDRAAEAVIISLSGSNKITFSKTLEFDGVEFKAKGIGYISHNYFGADAATAGMTIKNSVIASVTTFIRDVTGGEYVFDNCYAHGVNQFIIWMTGGSLLFTNNTIDGTDCGGVTNSGGSAFRFRGAVDAKFYHNTFNGNYTTYPGYIEPNVNNGTKGSLDIQYNVFNNVTNYFYNGSQSGLTLMATLNNNVYTDAEGTVTAVPATLANNIAGVTVDTNTFASVADLEAAWAAKAKIAALAVEYMADWNAATGLSLTAAKLDTNYCSSSDMTKALSDASMNAKWGWLYTAINTVTNNADMAIGTADVSAWGVKGYYFANLCGLFNLSQHTDTNLSATSYDWSSPAAFVAIANAIPTTQN